MTSILSACYGCNVLLDRVSCVPPSGYGQAAEWRHARRDRRQPLQILHIDTTPQNDQCVADTCEALPDAEGGLDG